MEMKDIALREMYATLAELQSKTSIKENVVLEIYLRYKLEVLFDLINQCDIEINDDFLEQIEKELI